MRFEWDPKKAAANLAKHGMSFEEAQTAFADKLGAYYPDKLHAERFICGPRSYRTKRADLSHGEARS